MKFKSFEIDSSVEGMVICLLLRRPVLSRKFAVSVVLEDCEGADVEVEKWPVYRRLGYPAKFVRLSEAGELITMTDIKNSVGSGKLSVAVTNKKGIDVDLGELGVLMKLRDSSAAYLVRGLDG